jgi:hypothetical protein
MAGKLIPYTSESNLMHNNSAQHSIDIDHDHVWFWFSNRHLPGISSGLLSAGCPIPTSLRIDYFVGISSSKQ